MVSTDVPVDFIAGVNPDAEDSGMEIDAAAGIKDGFAEGRAAAGHAALNGPDEGCRANIGKEIQDAAFQENEIASSFCMQLDSAIGMNNAKAQLGDVESDAVAYDLHSWMLEVIGALGFQRDVVTQPQVDASAKADGIIGKGWNIETAEAAKATQFDQLCEAGSGQNRQEGKQDKVPRTHYVSFSIPRPESGQGIVVNTESIHRNGSAFRRDEYARKPGEAFE